MKKTFGILGAGMQGTCAAYDLARFADAERIRLADASLEQAQRSALRVNGLVGQEICEAVQLDVLDSDALLRFLEPLDVVLSCVPYWMHAQLVPTSILAKTHWCDLGGDTDITMQILSNDAAAKAAGVTVISDNGLAPGLVNSIGLFLIESLDEAESVKLYCGVLPQHPRPPFNYKLTFNIEGLVAEYENNATVLRDGEIVKVPTLTELETLTVDLFGEMEAFTTSGGTSTAPYTLKDRVRNYEYKTIRHPGHCERMRIFKDFGFWGQEPIIVDGNPVVPRHLFYRVFGNALKAYEDQDLCIVRGIGSGTKNGQPATIQADILDKEDSETGFTSMERLTGFSIAIHAIEVSKGSVPPGCIRYENAMTGHRFVEEIRRRGIQITVQS